MSGFGVVRLMAILFGTNDEREQRFEQMIRYHQDAGHPPEDMRQVINNIHLAEQLGYTVIYGNPPTDPIYFIKGGKYIWEYIKGNDIVWVCADKIKENFSNPRYDPDLKEVLEREA